MTIMKANEREQRRIKIKLLQDINWENYKDMEVATIIFEVVDMISWFSVEGIDKDKVMKFSKYYGRDPFLVFGDFMCERDEEINKIKRRTYGEK